MFLAVVWGRTVCEWGGGCLYFTYSIAAPDNCFSSVLRRPDALASCAEGMNGVRTRHFGFDSKSLFLTLLGRRKFIEESL